MSRIGNRILSIPTGISVEIKNDFINITGPKGILDVNFNNKLISVKHQDNKLVITRLNEDKETKMLHGTTNANIANAILGVNNEFKKELVLKGVGYKAKVEGKKLVLTLGFSHPVELDIPNGIKVETPSNTDIIITSINKQAIGQFCAVIRKYRPPEPYKGKGILFKNEQIIRKVGKKAEK